MGTGHQGSRHQHPRVNAGWPDKGRRIRLIGIAAALAFAAALGPAAFAQTPTETWPNRFVRLIVPFPPGGGADAIARILSARLSDTWGQQVVIENRGGASGNIAAEAAARSAPDGYTIFLAGDFQAVNLYLYPKLTYDPVADFMPVTLVVQYPCAMIVPNSSPARSVPEFIAHAKANSGKLSFATPGHGTAPHLAGELFKRAAGIALTTIPYRGAAPAIQDVIPGRVDLFFNNIAPLLSLMQQGQLRALAVTTAQRSAAFPEIPAIGEFVPGYEANLRNGLGAPKATPADIVEKLNAAVNAGLADPTIKSRFADLGTETAPLTPAEWGKIIVEETEKWGKVIRSAGIKAQ